MSITLATKGIIAQFAPSGGGYSVYVPMEEPELSDEVLGERSLYTKEFDPRIQTKELRPKIRVE